MADDDFRVFNTYYGIYVSDWEETYPGFANHHMFLVDEYINEGCSCITSSRASDTNEFLYPHYIKETYFIEGIIKGHVSFACSGCTGYITDYRVTVCKVNTDTTKTELFTTGWKTLNHTLGWDGTYPSITENILGERVYPFWIDAWNKEILTKEDRIFLRIETHSNNCVVLWHSNDSTWEDVKIEVPYKM